MLTLKVFFAYLQDEVWRDVRASVSSIEGAIIEGKSGGVENNIDSIGKDILPDVLIVELGSGEEEIEDFLKRLGELRHMTEVFITQASTNVEVMRTLMRYGIRDFIPQPVDKRDLINQITNVLSEKRERLMSDKGRLASVFSFMNAKGGSGASTIAVNVATILAEKKEAKVVLLDFDIQLGSVALALDITPKSTIYDALTQSSRVDPVFLKALVHKHKSGLDVLASPSNLTSISQISPNDVKCLLDAASEAYDIVICDLPLLFNSWVLEAMKCSERVFYVLQNTISAINDAKNIIDNLPKHKVPVDMIEIINNRAQSAVAVAVPIKDLTETLKIEGIHSIRTDYKAATTAQNQGKMIREVAPRSKIEKDLEALADYLYEIALPDRVQQPKSLWGKLFSGNKSTAPNAQRHS